MLRSNAHSIGPKILIAQACLLSSTRVDRFLIVLVVSLVNRVHMIGQHAILNLLTLALVTCMKLHYFFTHHLRTRLLLRLVIANINRKLTINLNIHLYYQLSKSVVALLIVVVFMST